MNPITEAGIINICGIVLTGVANSIINTLLAKQTQAHNDKLAVASDVKKEEIAKAAQSKFEEIKASTAEVHTLVNSSNTALQVKLEASANEIIELNKKLAVVTERLNSHQQIAPP